MECNEARDLLWLGPSGADAPLTAHLERCAACAAETPRARRLDQLIRPAMLVAPPPAVAARALRAALAAASARRPAPSLSLAAYALAGLIFALAAGLLGLGPLAVSDAVLGRLVQPLGLVLSSPAVWVLPAPEALARLWLSWLGLAVLAWALREATERPPGAESR